MKGAEGDQLSYGHPIQPSSMSHPIHLQWRPASPSGGGKDPVGHSSEILQLMSISNTYADRKPAFCQVLIWPSLLCNLNSFL